MSVEGTKATGFKVSCDNHGCTVWVVVASKNTRNARREVQKKYGFEADGPSDVCGACAARQRAESSVPNQHFTLCRPHCAEEIQVEVS